MILVAITTILSMVSVATAKPLAEDETADEPLLLSLVKQKIKALNDPAEVIPLCGPFWIVAIWCWILVNIFGYVFP